jgi:hypothetical protein
LWSSKGAPDQSQEQQAFFEKWIKDRCFISRVSLFGFAAFSRFWGRNWTALALVRQRSARAHRLPLGKAVMRAELLRRRLGGDARRCASLQFCPGSFAFGDETEKVAGITRGGQEVEPGEVLRPLNAVAQIA